MALSKDAVRELYRARSGHYDFAANLYYLIGFRETKYRKLAISHLKLESGDTAVEIGCGTGLNFKYVQRFIGDTGQLIGVDLTDAMLAQARSRVERYGWKNVRLVQSDAAHYSFPQDVNGMYSTFALTLIPEYELVIERASRAIVDGGRFVLMDLKRPQGWPHWSIKLGIAITKPFGVTEDLAERKPWEIMQGHFRKVTITDLYAGFAYIAVAEK
jgi:ubiquinone/menaquinone biosynthesis C-methylase UbiE